MRRRDSLRRLDIFDPIKTLVFGYQTNQASGLLGNITRRPTAISVYTGRIPAPFPKFADLQAKSCDFATSATFRFCHVLRPIPKAIPRISAFLEIWSKNCEKSQKPRNRRKPRKSPKIAKIAKIAKIGDFVEIWVLRLRVALLAQLLLVWRSTRAVIFYC